MSACACMYPGCAKAGRCLASSGGMDYSRVDLNLVQRHIFSMNKLAKPWRRLVLCATVPSHKDKRGKKARKAAFAVSARRCRKWVAEYKRQALESGAYYLTPNV